jgi:hypothetical protein
MLRTIAAAILLDLLLIYGGLLQVLTDRASRGRHRATGPSTMERAVAAAKAAARRVAAEPEMLITGWLGDESGDLDRTGPGGAGRYAHLRREELDATAERALLLVERGLRSPSVWGAPEVVDEWELEPVLAGVS